MTTPLGEAIIHRLDKAIELLEVIANNIRPCEHEFESDYGGPVIFHEDNTQCYRCRKCREYIPCKLA